MFMCQEKKVTVPVKVNKIPNSVSRASFSNVYLPHFR